MRLILEQHTLNALLDATCLSLPDYLLDMPSPLENALCILRKLGLRLDLPILRLTERSRCLSCHTPLKPLRIAPPSSSPSPPKPSSRPSTAFPHPPRAHLPRKVPQAAAALSPKSPIFS